MISVDSGNTSIKVLIFNNDGSVQSRHTWAQADRDSCLEWLRQRDEEIYLCDSTGYHWNLGVQISSNHSWTFKVDYEATVGVDRLVALEGLLHHFQKLPLLLISLGTCLTYNYLNAEGHFQGGGIAPGWASRLRAMHEHTGSLPELDLAFQLDADPRTTSTQQSMLRGAAQGLIDEINAEIVRFEKINTDLMVVVTGGDGPTFVNHLKKGIFADENWVARGLWALANK